MSLFFIVKFDFMKFSLKQARVVSGIPFVQQVFRNYWFSFDCELLDACIKMFSLHSHAILRVGSFVFYCDSGFFGGGVGRRGRRGKWCSARDVRVLDINKFEFKVESLSLKVVSWWIKFEMKHLTRQTALFHRENSFPASISF